MRFLVMVAALAACSGGSSESADKGSKPSAKRRAKYIQVSLEILPGSAPGEVDAGGLMEITLILTDETGSTRRISLGEYPGPCEDVSGKDKSPMKPLLSALCRGGEGLRIRLVQKDRNLVLWKAPGITGDEFDFDVFHEYEMPEGAGIGTEQR